MASLTAVIARVAVGSVVFGSSSCPSSRDGVLFHRRSQDHIETGREYARKMKLEGAQARSRSLLALAWEAPPKPTVRARQVVVALTHNRFENDKVLTEVPCCALLSADGDSNSTMMKSLAGGRW